MDFLKKIQHCHVGNWYFHLFEWGKIITKQEVQGISAEYERSTKNAWCILKIRTCFQKVH